MYAALDSRPYLRKLSSATSVTRAACLRCESEAIELSFLLFNHLLALARLLPSPFTPDLQTLNSACREASLVPTD
jgi:hypothetical protein